MNKQCVNCPGAVDHSTAECPLVSEQSKIDAERAKFESWMHTYDFPPSLEGEIFNDERYPNADCFGQFVYDDLATQRCWSAWQARSSLPVGVPSIRDFADEVKQLCKDFSDLQNRPYMGDVTAAIDGLYEQFMQSDAILAAPTVKAEQADDRAECIADGLSVGMSQEEAEEFADKIAAPSLPAAGSAVEEVEVVAHIAIDDPTPEEHGDWDIEPDAAKLNELARRGGGHIQLMTVAQHNRIVAALSAQQSAPERVSVPVELVSKLVRTYERSIIDEAHWTDMDGEVTKLRALLASHAEGGKV